MPITLALIGDLFPFQERGRPLGWVFGAIAGGMACGSTAGVMLEPLVGWRGLFLGVAGLGTVVGLVLMPSWSLVRGAPQRTRLGCCAMVAGYVGLLRSGRGRRTYAYVAGAGIAGTGGWSMPRAHSRRETRCGVGPRL